MKKITSLIASFLLLIGMSANAQITTPSMATGKLLTAEELNASKGTKTVAIQLVHSGNEYGNWYTGTGNHYHSAKEYTKASIFEWIEKDGAHLLKKVANGKYSSKNNPHVWVEEADAQLFHVATPVAGGTGEAVAGFSNTRDEHREAFCRFVKHEGGSWMNANAAYNTGNGTWTMFYVYDLTDHVDGKVFFNTIEGAAITGLEAGAKMTTFSSPVATQVPAGVKAYHVVEGAADATVASLKEVAGNIPANQGVVLVSQNETAVMTAVEGEVPALEASVLLGSSNGCVAMQASDYVLATVEGVTQFYKATAKLSANKAYLRLPAASAAALKMNFGGEATGIEAVETENADAPVYDLSGRRVNQLVKGGIYIQNGKKFIK